MATRLLTKTNFPRDTFSVRSELASAFGISNGHLQFYFIFSLTNYLIKLKLE